MNNIQPTCWERFKECWPCCRDKKPAPIPPIRGIQNVVERAIEPVKFQQVQPKHHHVGRSDDIITFQQCIQEENQGNIHEHRRIIYDKGINRPKEEST